jgi:hypothetical protein
MLSIEDIAFVTLIKFRVPSSAEGLQPEMDLGNSGFAF